jgi:formate hydrogenlyase subunit 6/NADH:ubiquinone oxidoreductase subunit I
VKFERFGLGLLKGMTVTLTNLFRHPTVNQFPEQRLNISRRTRGNELVWSRERCTGCGTCAKTCPQGAILIETSVNMTDNKYQVDKYQVDTGYCIQCGLCVEACPYDALFMGYAYERAQYRRGDLVQSDDAMLESPARPASGYYHPDIATKLPRQTLLIDKIVEKRK